MPSRITPKPAVSGICSATPQSYIAAPLLNACIPSSVAFSVYDSKVILSDFKALHFRVESSCFCFKRIAFSLKITIFEKTRLRSVFARAFVCSQVIGISMADKEKMFYEAPSTEVFELRHEGVICASEVRGGNSINGWGNGGSTNEEIYL